MEKCVDAGAFPTCQQAEATLSGLDGEISLLEEKRAVLEKDRAEASALIEEGICTLEETPVLADDEQDPRAE